MHNKLLSSCSILFLFFTLIEISKVHSQTTFVERIGSANSDYAPSCQPTKDNGIILVEQSSTNGMDLHFILTKTDSTGNVDWSKLYQIGQWCVPYSVLQAKDEGYIVYGSTSDTALLNNNDYKLFLYKTDMSGNKQWNKQFSLSDDDLALNLVHRKAGGYIAFSIADYNLGVYPKAAVTAIDLNGNIIWSKQFSSPYWLTPSKGTELPNGNICFVTSAGNSSGTPFNDIVVMLLDSAGNLLWTKEFGTYYDDEPNAVTSNSSNEIFVTGRSYIMNREWDSFFLKLDKDGNKLLSNFYDAGTSNGEIMRCIIAKEDGTSILLGDIGTFDERDITMINIDSNAAVKSAKRYSFSPTYTNYPYEMFIGKDGGIIFTGDYAPPTAYRDAIIAKTESNGDLPCFTSNITFDEYNEILSDTDLVLDTISSIITNFNFPDSIPFNIIQNHIVCPLATNIETPDQDHHISAIYPNPTSGKITLETNGHNLIEKITIYSIDGKKISEEIIKNKSENITISLEDLSAGIYFMECGFKNYFERIKIEKF